MTLSIRNTLRSLSLLALTAAFIPGCDNEEYEALGLSSEEIDAMSEEELDELAALEDDLEHSVDQKHLTAAQHPGEPDPTHPPDALLTDRPVDRAHTGISTDGFDDVWHPTHTHAGVSTEGHDAFWHPTRTHEIATEGFDTLWRPIHTHEGVTAEGFDTLWHPTHTHAQGPVDGISSSMHPTHDVDPSDEIGLTDPGCKPDTYKPVLTANG